MTSLSQWDPFRDPLSLRDAMGQLLEQAVMRPGNSRWSALGGSYGAMNVWEAERAYVCQMLLPGVERDQIELTVRQNTLTISVTIPDTPKTRNEQPGTYLLQEFGAGQVSRSLSFPKDVRGGGVEARYEDGVLTVTVPIAEHAQPQRITIQEGRKTADRAAIEQDSQVTPRADGQDAVGQLNGAR